MEGKAQGYGVHTWPNKDKYEGEWLKNLRHGNGSDFFDNGDQYVGQYVNGKPEGFGQYKWVNGSNYTGTFSQGMKHGHGKWRRKPSLDKHPKSTRFPKNTTATQQSNYYEGSYLND